MEYCYLSGRSKFKSIFRVSSSGMLRVVCRTAKFTLERFKIYKEVDCNRQVRRAWKFVDFPIIYGKVKLPRVTRLIFPLKESLCILKGFFEPFQDLRISAAALRRCTLILRPFFCITRECTHLARLQCVEKLFSASTFPTRKCTRGRQLLGETVLWILKWISYLCNSSLS